MKNKNSRGSTRPPLLAIAAAIAVVVLLAIIFWPSKSGALPTAFHEVKRGDFTVTVVEGGTLTAVSEVVVRSEVEGTARIISIVPEGSIVKKGDLLVELDSSQARDQLNVQQINYEKAKFGVEQAEAQLEIMRSATNSDFLAADLKVKFAKIDREKYLQAQEMVDLVEASNKVVQVKAQLAVNLDTYMHSTNLASKGYETKQKVDGDRLSVLNTENAYIVATNQLWMLSKFDMLKSREKYDSDVLQAEQELQRVVSQNNRKMAQYYADLLTQKTTLELSKQKLERDQKNLDAAKIFAPQGGLVVYQVSENRFSSESLIEGGAVVRNRQELIKLPDLSRMKVTVKVHESHVGMVRAGLPAFVILDSMPDIRFRGVVDRVAPLPDTQARWGNPNLKVYNTDILLTESVPNVKPGVSAKAEVVITNIADALSVPIQAVTTLKGKQVVYVASGSSTEPRPVEVGMYNTKFIQVLNGVNAGDRVLLSPPFDTQSQDLGGEILSADEKVSAATNAPTEPAPRPSELGPSYTSTPEGQPAVPVAMQASAAIENGDDARNGAANNAPGGAPAGGFNPAEFMKQFDKNGDGQIDETEREAIKTAMAARMGSQGGPGGGFDREEMVKRFDKNGDGELDDEERTAMRASFGQRAPGGRGGRRDGGPNTGTPGAAGRGEARPVAPGTL